MEDGRKDRIREERDGEKKAYRQSFELKEISQIEETKFFFDEFSR